MFKVPVTFYFDFDSIGKAAHRLAAHYRSAEKAPRLKVVQSEVIPVRTGTFIRELVEKFDELAELG